MTRRVPFVALLALVGGLGLGCHGDPRLPNLKTGGAGQEPMNNAGGQAIGGMGGTAMTACPDAPRVPAARRLRRLSRVEYLNAVADLLPTLSTATIRALVRSPPDTTEDGFENQTRFQRPSALWLEEIEAAAVALAAAATHAGGAAALLACEPGQVETDCVSAFVARIGGRAFRRPIEVGELAEYMALYAEARASIDHEAAVEVLLQAFLQSPHFLYRPERSGDDFELASRLAFLAWQSPPDSELVSLAAEGRLREPAVRRAQVERLLADERAAIAFADFQRQWLGLELLLGREKDRDAFPEWGPKSAQAALDEAAWLAGQVFKGAFGPGTLAELLRAPAAAQVPTASATHPAAERAGILTRPAFLALHARSLHGSPPLRGMAVARQLLCQDLPAPPADADLSEPTAAPGEGTSNRQRFEARTSPARCAGCHAQTDAIGFAFEHYDAVGAYRTLDNGMPVNARGVLSGAGSADGPVADAIELSHRLAGSEVVSDCLVAKFFQFAEGRPPDVGDSCRLKALQRKFLASGGNLAELILDVALADLDFAAGQGDLP